MVQQSKLLLSVVTIVGPSLICIGVGFTGRKLIHLDSEDFWYQGET